MFLIYAITLLTIFLPKLKDESKFIFTFCLFLALTIFRYGIGADYFSYSLIYNSLDTNNVYSAMASQERYEPMIKIIFYIFHKFNLTSTQALSLYSSIIYSLFSVWIYRNAKNKAFSMLLFISMFYFVWTLSALRQAVPILIGCYLFFDKTEKPFLAKVLLIFIAVLFHNSGLFLIILWLFNAIDIDFSRKNLVIMLLISLAVSIFPYEQLFSAMTLNSFFKKLTNYGFEQSFLTFGYVVRLIFSIILILYYNKMNTFDKKLASNILFGFSIYFLLSFSPIVAGRISIYTYILLVILLPQLNYVLKYKFLGYVGFIIFSSTYFLKEVKTLQLQSGYIGTNIPLIFNKDDYKFDKYEYFRNNKNLHSKEIYDDFSRDLRNKTLKGYDPDEYNFPGWDNNSHSYLIYNTKGDLSINYPMRGNPKIYKDVLVNEYSNDLIFNELRYIDLSGRKRDLDTLLNVVTKYEELERESKNITQKLLVHKFEELPLETQDIVEFPNRMSNYRLINIQEPFEYNIISFNYYYDEVYIVLDSDFRPIIPLLLDKVEPFDFTETAYVYYYGKRIHINRFGDPIWIG